ncbi:MAG: hypothetical protein KC964_03140 [Candidatus Omnitrophica bacterium]|nr:hypothetical protein [Candidatus Omnitrophota bacterium]
MKTCRLFVVVWAIFLIHQNSSKECQAVGPCLEHNESISDDDGFPKGTENVANHPTRVSCYGGRTHYIFEYRVKDTTEFNTILKSFGAIQSPTLEIVVNNGPKEQVFNEGRVDFEFVIALPRWRDHEREKVMGEVAPQLEDCPRLRLYLSERGKKISRKMNVWMDGGLRTFVKEFEIGPGAIDWSAVVVPGNVTVVDKRETAIVGNPPHQDEGKDK